MPSLLGTKKTIAVNTKRTPTYSNGRFVVSPDNAYVKESLNANGDVAAIISSFPVLPTNITVPETLTTGATVLLLTG